MSLPAPFRTNGQHTQSSIISISWYRRLEVLFAFRQTPVKRIKPCQICAKGAIKRFEFLSMIAIGAVLKRFHCRRMEWFLSSVMQSDFIVGMLSV